MEEEQHLTPQEEEQSRPYLTISNTAIAYLSETGKWTKFLSIIGFFFVGLIVIMALFAGSLMSYLPQEQMGNIPSGIGALFGGVYLLMGLLYFFPTWYLFKFSQKIKLALTTQNNEDLNAALGNQKSFFKFWGILMAIIIGFYVFFGLIALLVSVLI